MTAGRGAPLPGPVVRPPGPLHRRVLAAHDVRHRRRLHLRRAERRAASSHES